MKKFIIPIVMLAFLSGCTAPVRNYVPEAKSFSIPPLNESTTTYVGEDMVKQGVDSSVEALHFEQSTQIGSSFYYVIPSGDYPKIGQNKDSEFFSATEKNSGVTVPNRPMINDPVQSIQIKNNGEICIISIFNGTKCDTGKLTKKVKLDTSRQSSFQQTLVYNGKFGNKINIGYREYSEGLARPAFSNEVEYDLSESRTIRYKGAIMEIVEANNQFITFKLLKNFNMQ